MIQDPKTKEKMQMRTTNDKQNGKL